MKNKFNLVKKYKSISIGNKITFLYATIFSISFIILTIFIMLNTWYYYEDVSKSELSETMDIVIEYIENGNKITDNKINELSPNKNVEIRIFKGNGKNKFDILNRTDYPSPRGNPPPLPEREDFEQNENPNDKNNRNGFNMETIKGTHYMSIKGKAEYKDNIYFIEVFRTNEREHDILKNFGILFIIANILGIIGSVAIGRFISKKILKPISIITKTAGQISINDLSQRIDVPSSNDEVANLAITFNDMLKRLNEAFENQKEFVSNASHELKTPISVIQGYANLIDRWGKSEPEILQESIDSIKDETEYMSNLVKKLLFLAKNEQEQITEKVEFNLNEVVNEVVRETNVLDFKGSFNIVEHTEVKMLGDVNLIKQLLWIFFENAIKYSDKQKEHSEINVDISEDNDFIILKISDNGIGIKEEDINHIFERFFRADKSHNKTISGNGLGLSIALNIVKQHNGKIDVFSKEGKGTDFIISFPK